MNEVNPELAVDLAAEPLDDVTVTFQIHSGTTNADTITKARSLGMMFSQLLGLETLTVKVAPGGDHLAAVQQTLPLSDHELVELQLAIADSVRDDDPEFAAILEEAAAAASQH